MNKTYEIPLIVNNQYKHEYMTKLIYTLENLEVIKCNSFNKMNQALSERVAKLENLKSRINHAINIISTYEGLSSQAMTMKSKLIYPLDEPIYTRSLNFDQNSNISQNKSSLNFLNTNKKNDVKVLGSAPFGNIQEAEITQLTQNFFSVYQNVYSIIDQIHRNPSRIADDNVNPILECYNSAFNIFDKSMIIGKKIQAPIADMNEYANLAGFLQTTEQKKKKMIQAAPESITKKEKLIQLDKKKNVYLRNQVEVNINLPNMMNLGNISDFGIEKELFEQTVVDNTNVIDLDDDDLKYDQRLSSIDEDINTPMDLIKNRKGFNPIIKPTVAQSVQPTTYTVSSSLVSSSVPQSSNPSVLQVPLGIPNVPTVGTPQVVSNSAAGIPMPPPMSFPQKTTVQPPQATKPPSIPSVPSIPSIPSVPSIPTVVKGSGPGVPLPPPMAMINLTIPVVPTEPIEQNKTTKTVAKKPAEPRPLTMQEEIGSNPMARLKKVGDIKVSEKGIIFYLNFNS